MQIKDLIITEIWRVIQIKSNKGKTVHWDKRVCCGICWILSGHMLFRLENETVECKKNDAVFIPEGIEYTIEYPQDTHFVLFNFKVLEQFEEIKKIENVNFYNHFKAVRNYFTLGTDIKIHHVFSTLYEVLAKFSDYGSTNKYAAMVDMAEKAIIENYNNSDFTCKDLADKLGITDTYLRLIFKKQHGIPPGQFLLKTRMNEATYLLMDNTSVTKVAELVGYKDVFQFSKAYKKYFGYSPKIAKTRDMHF